MPTASQYKVGMYNKNFKMASQEMLEEKIVNIGGEEARFNITAGPLLLGKEPLKETYILEVRYKPSQDAHAGDFGACLFADSYMQEATKLAKKFCKKMGWMINNHLNSWPEYQAVVSKR